MFHERIQPAPDLAHLLAEIAACSSRPRYAFMLLSLIAQNASKDGSFGPFIRVGAENVPIRDWLSDALSPMGGRAPRRLELHSKLKDELAASQNCPEEPAERKKLLDLKVKEHVRAAGKSNLSRGVTELVNAGLLERHYQGSRVDHQNRGAQRHAVYRLAGAAQMLIQARQPRLVEDRPAQASFPF